LAQGPILPKNMCDTLKFSSRHPLSNAKNRISITIVCHKLQLLEILTILTLCFPTELLKFKQHTCYWQ